MPDAVHIQSDSLISSLLLAQEFAAYRNVGEISTMDIVFALATSHTLGSIILNGLLQNHSKVDDFGKALAASVRAHEFFTDENLTFSRPAGQVIVLTNKIALKRGVTNRQGVVEVGSDHLVVALTEVETADSRAFLAHFGINSLKVRELAFN